MNRAGEWLLQLLFPPRCPFCGDLLEREEAAAGVCDRCAGTIAFSKRNTKRLVLVDSTLWALDYEGAVRDAIHAYKFIGHKGHSTVFVRLMLYAYRSWEEPVHDLITWPPSNPSTIRKRGFHHVGLLAEKLSRELGIPALDTMKKVRKTKSMFGLEPAARRANILGAIGLSCDPDLIRGKRVLLIDDILTTGATASECARILKEAGAVRVDLLTLSGAQK